MNKTISKKILFMVNVDWFFQSHRLPIALAALDKGFEVHLATSITNKQDTLTSYGIMIHPLPFVRSKFNVVEEIKTLIAIIKLITLINPDILHLVTIKPILYGGLVARLAKIENIVIAFSGLGHVFTTRGWKANFRRFIVEKAYQFALKQNKVKVIFQNSNDRDKLVRTVQLQPEQIVYIPGSGVDLSYYKSTVPPTGVPVVLMAARLLHDKGVFEFINAANILKKRGVDVRFQLAGKVDLENPHSITEIEVNAIKNEGVVEILGHRTDMPLIFANSNIFVLPSYYGEGLAKVLIEAAACGRPIVTTDISGCRDAIIPGETGLLVPPKDEQALANAIEKLVLDPSLCIQMGIAGRKFADKYFSIEHVINTHLSIYNELLNMP